MYSKSRREPPALAKGKDVNCPHVRSVAAGTRALLAGNHICMTIGTAYLLEADGGNSTTVR
jgi:hypothetical protein